MCCGLQHSGSRSIPSACGSRFTGTFPPKLDTSQSPFICSPRRLARSSSLLLRPTDAGSAGTGIDDTLNVDYNALTVAYQVRSAASASTECQVYGDLDVQES